MYTLLRIGAILCALLLIPTAVQGQAPAFLLWTRGDGAIALQQVGGTRPYTNMYGPYAGWTAISLATANGTRRPRILWQRYDGALSLWTVRPDGSFTYRDFPPNPGFTAYAVRVGPDDYPRIAWISNDGTHLSLWTLAGPTAVTKATYEAPPGYGWPSIDIGPDTLVRLLWPGVDGSAVLWTIEPSGVPAAQTYGPFPGWTPEALRVGADNLVRVMWHYLDGRISLWIVQPDGSFSYQDYGPYPGWTPTALAGGEAGPQVLWVQDSGALSLWTLDAQGGLAYQDFAPITGWSFAELAPAPVPPPNPSPGPFPIGGWSGPLPAFLTASRFGEMAAAGFTFSMPHADESHPAAQNLQALHAAAAAGMRLMIQDDGIDAALDTAYHAMKAAGGVEDPTLLEALRAAIDAAVKNYAAQPALAGYFLEDEPSEDEFPILGAAMAYLHARDPNHPAYVNLFPNFEGSSGWGAGSYGQYTGDYTAMVSPSLLSCDFYPFLGSGADRTGYWSNLSTMRSLSAQYGIPFWQILQVTPHQVLNPWGSVLVAYRDPTQAQKRWQAMQALAYGARGLIDFCYWTPDPAHNPGFAPDSGIIALDGTETARYTDAAWINHDVQAIGTALAAAQLDMVFQNPYGWVPPDGNLPPPDGSPVVFNGAGAMTLGLFHDSAYNYALFASLDYSNYVNCPVTVATGGSGLQRLNRANGTWITEANRAPAVSASVFLSPGDAELYRWSR